MIPVGLPADELVGVGCRWSSAAQQRLENSIDLILTDPPYFGIVGEEWDTFQILDEFT